jgi:hypothetical protein
MIIRCPQCRERIEADDSWRGQDVDCPVCSTTITLPSGPVARPASKPPPLPENQTRQHSVVSRLPPQERVCIFCSRNEGIPACIYKYQLHRIINVGLPGPGRQTFSEGWRQFQFPRCAACKAKHSAKEIRVRNITLSIILPPYVVFLGALVYSMLTQSTAVNWEGYLIFLFVGIFIPMAVLYWLFSKIRRFLDLRCRWIKDDPTCMPARMIDTIPEIKELRDCGFKDHYDLFGHFS